MNNMVLAAAYVVMALGLNIIVGFAGLLDLGYVAFFAIGAYTMGYFGSGFWCDAGGGEGIHILVARARVEPAGHPPQLPDHPRARGDRDDDRGHAHRPADAAPARRLHRDRDARVRRDHRPHRDQRRRDQPVLGSSSPPAARASRRSTRSTCRSFERFTSLDLRPWYWVALALVVLVLFVNFRLRDSRLGPRVDRAARGRGRRRVAWASRSSRRSCWPTAPAPRSAACPARSSRPTSTRSTPTSSSSRSRSSSSRWSSSAAWDRSGASCSARSSLSVINNYLIPDVFNSVPSKIGLDFDLTELSFGDLRLPAA